MRRIPELVRAALLPLETRPRAEQEDRDTLWRVFNDAFLRADEEFRIVLEESGTPEGGATAVVFVLWRCFLLTASVGDSRGMVLGLVPGADDVKVLFETTEFDLDIRAPDTQRALRSGGELVRQGAYLSTGTAGKPRSTKLLAMSRSLGDYSLKTSTPPVVIAEPEVKLLNLSRLTRLFLVIGSDGLWSVLPQSHAVSPRTQVPVTSPLDRDQTHAEQRRLVRETVAAFYHPGPGGGRGASKGPGPGTGTGTRTRASPGAGSSTESGEESGDGEARGRSMSMGMRSGLDCAGVVRSLAAQSRQAGRGQGQGRWWEGTLYFDDWAVLVLDVEPKCARKEEE